MMSKLICLWIFALITLLVQTLKGRDLSGQWQGTLPVKGGVRMVVKVMQAEDGRLSATLTEIDESPEAIPIKSVSLTGNTFAFAFDGSTDRYEGTIGEEDTVISGLWYSSRHPGTTYPLDLHHVTGAIAWPLDSSPHKIGFVTVDHNVNLEVLDWGGTGRPLVLLAGLGDTAHTYDKFAPKLIPTYHVYGITRRGFGASNAPEPANGNYSADRLGDDILETIDVLRLDRPVLAGHSIAGGELSSIGSRHPEKIAGLIYLDAGYPYAFYDRGRGDFVLDAHGVQAKLAKVISFQTPPREAKILVDDLLRTDLPQLIKSLEQTQRELAAKSDAALSRPAPPDTPDVKFVQAVMAGEQKYTEIKCPVLAFFAIPPAPDPASENDPLVETEVELASAAAQAKAFETGVPTARVVRLRDADHYVFKSNEADVLREMHSFLGKLP